MNRKQYKVAVFVETSRGYGRALCEGIADFAQANGHWTFQGGGDSWEEGLLNRIETDYDHTCQRQGDQCDCLRIPEMISLSKEIGNLPFSMAPDNYFIIMNL